MGIRQGFVVNDHFDLETAVHFAADRGFDFLELDMEFAFPHREVDPAVVRRTAAEHGVDLVVHLPHRLDVASPHEYVRTGACRELEAAIDTAIQFGAETGVYHAATFAHPEASEDDVLREQLHKSVRRLTEYASDRDFDACVENLKESFFDAGDFPTLFEETKAPACLDTGHAYVSGYDAGAQAALLRDHPDRIAHLHLNDTRTRADDEHLPVGLGQFDFEPISTALAERDRDVTCTHEVYGFDLSYCDHGKQEFDRLLERAR